MPAASPSTPASPPVGRLAPPSWLDTRLVLGVLLVLVSVVVGARVLAAADRTDLVYVAARDLAAGTVLERDDLRPVEVRLLSVQDVYLGAPSQTFVGYVVERDLVASELVPVDALVAPGEQTELRLVSVPVLPGHHPDDLTRGERVDVWLTPHPAAAPVDGAPPAGSTLVLEAVPVSRQAQSGGALSGAASDRAVVLAVPSDDVAALVAAMTSGRIDLVRVPSPVRAREELGGLGAGPD